MSASDKLNPGQFKTVYRGLPVHPKDVNTRFAGIHWSEDMDSAKGFAQPYFPIHDSNGVVIEAQVHPDHIVQPHTDEWHEYGGGDYDSGSGIFSPNHEEKETTIRRGAPITVTKLHHFIEGRKAGEVEPSWEQHESA